MNDSEKSRARFPQWKRYAWALAVVWTVVVAASLVWNVVQTRHNTLEAARTQARVAHGKDVTYRRWNAGHGGVYVLVTEETQPNPYLSHMPERDITTPSGKLLTLMNPAYMTRQVHELAEEEQGIRGHITSLNPIRPENAPDPWETGALQAFEGGETEISSVEEMEGEEYMRLMRPLITEKGCLKCHAAQGYQEGDIRGGISVSVPMEPLWAVARMQVLALAGGHAMLWLMGLGGIVLGTQRMRRSEQERKRAEEALRESETRYRTLFENSIEGIASSKENRIISANKAVLDIFGYDSFDEFARIPLLDHVAPESREMIKERLKKREKGELLEPRYEYKIVRKDGEIRDIEISTTQILIGNEEYVQGTFRDITERKRAEEELVRLSSAVKTSVDSIVITDVEGKIIDVNEAALKMYGADDKGDLIGQHSLNLVAPEQREKGLAGIEAVLEKGYDKSRGYEAITKDGRRIPVELSAAVMRDADGKPIGIVNIGRDITERVRAEEALKEYSERLEEMVEQRTLELQKAYSDLRDSQARLIQSEKLAATGRLAVSVAHEINNPLQGIGSYLSMISQQVAEDDPLHEDLDMVKLGFERVAEIVRRLRAFYRPAGKEMEPTDINGVVERVLALVGHQLSLGNVEVKRELAEHELPVLGSAGQLEQVLVNLALNAQEAMPQGGELTVRTTRARQCGSASGVGHGTRDQ